MVYLTSELWFPPHEMVDNSGIIAVGGDLSPERLILAYHNGIFPWFNKDEPILWWSPEKRMVLFPDKLNVSKSMQALLRKEKFRFTHNKNFKEVIEVCSSIKRKDQKDTWITNEMIKAYTILHQKGYAHSFEAWHEDKIAGGLYGVYLKRFGVFCGESMFSKESNASKYAFIKMIQFYQKKGLKLIDCQIYTKHLESLGAEIVTRNDFLSYLQ